MAFLMIVCSSFIYIVSCAREYEFYRDAGGNVVPVTGTDKWDSAFVSTLCEEQGMRAARIETAEDQVAANALCKTHGNTPCYFGLARNPDDGDQGPWHWQENGADVERIGSYSYWDAGQPHCCQGCVAIWKLGFTDDYGYKWHDLPCNWSDDEISLICEKITACEALEIDGFLDHCSDNYASMLADLDTKAAQSTLDDEIATINTALDTKADQTALDGAVVTINDDINDVKDIQATKADQSTLDDAVTGINTVLDTKADQSTLDDAVTGINTVLDTKADKTALSDAVDDINDALGTKADTTALDDAVDTINNALNGEVETINGEITTINGEIEEINAHLALLKGSGFGAQTVGELIDDGKATSWIYSNIFLLISLCTNVILVILAFYIALNKSRNDGKYNKVSRYADSSDTAPFKLNA